MSLGLASSCSCQLPKNFSGCLVLEGARELAKMPPFEEQVWRSCVYLDIRKRVIQTERMQLWQKTRGIGHVGPVGPLLKAHQLVCFEFWKQNHQDFYTTYQLRTSRTSQANPSGKASLKICHRDTAPQVAGMTNLVKLYSKITDQLS